MGQNTYWTNFKGNKKEMSEKLKSSGIKHHGTSNKAKKKAEERKKEVLNNDTKKKDEQTQAKFLLNLIKNRTKIKKGDLKQTLFVMKDSDLKDEFTFALIRIEQLRQELSSNKFSEYIKKKKELNLKYLEKDKKRKIFYKEMAKLVRDYYFL